MRESNPYLKMSEIDDRAKRTATLHATEKRTLEMIANGADLCDVLNELCAAIDTHSSGTSFVCLMDQAGKQLLPIAGPHLPSAFATAITPWLIGPNRGSCGTAAFTKQRVVIPDISGDPRWPDDARGLAIAHGVCAAWSEPLISKDGEVLGTFCISHTQARIPNDEDLEFIEAAGHIARIAIERKRSHEYTGLSPEESNDWAWQAAFHPDDLPPLMERWRELLASGEAGEIEGRLRRHDGVFRWFLIRVEPFRDETGKLIRWYGTSTDIEALKQTQEKLREDERELRRITDAIPQTIVVLDAPGAPIYDNQATLDYAGRTSEDVLAPDFRERIFPPDDLERLRGERKAAVERGFPFEAEMRALGKDGQYRWFLIRYNPFRNEQGEVTRWYATGTDIHERVRMEERTRNENLALREQIDRDSMFEDIVGSSEALRKVLRQVTKVAPAESTVLLLGETGTGKELIARAIHKRSNRAERAFMAVNCAAIPTSLIASELFGHAKGAFTGATQRRLGRFESANGGTIFLDEIGDLPAETQIALLRVLQEREVERVGSSQPISVDVRVVAATNIDLMAAVSTGKFREDLFYRLNVFPIQIPSLRERVDDIPLLVEYLIERYAKKTGKKIKTITKK